MEQLTTDLVEPWQRLVLLATEYAGHVADAAQHQAESRADISRTRALKTLGKMREAFFAHCKVVEQGARNACAIAVWMTLQDALAPGADDKGLDGWMREAERRVKRGEDMPPQDAVRLQVIAAADQLPDADIDVLIWYGGDPQSDIGAWIGYHDDGTVHWVDAQGGDVSDVTHWAEMPCLPKR